MMKVFWGNPLEELKNALDALIKAEPSLPHGTSYQSQTILIADIIKSLKQLVRQLIAYEDVDLDGIMFAVHFSNVQSMLSLLPTQINSFIAQQAASPSVDNLVNHIWSLQSSLAYFLPSERSTINVVPVLTKDSKTRINEIEKINQTLLQTYQNIEKHQKTIENSRNKTKRLILDIENDALEISNAKSNAESNAIQSAMSKDKVDELAQEITLNKNLTDALLLKLDEIKDKAEKTLGSASQVALADSFKKRKKTLEISQEFWIKAFILGLVCLFSFTAITILYSDFYHLPPIVNKGNFDAWGAILRLLLASPIIWFTWFAVRQYGNNVALIEDYAFKEASALAFVGYRKDMEDDIEMVKLLRESAIRNFSYAPSRLISSSEASSPMHDLFEKAFQDKGAFDKLVRLLQAIKPGKN